MLNRRTGWIGALVLAASLASAQITLDFNVASTNSGASRLYNGGGDTMTFDFTVDGLGNVSLDASTTSGDPIDIDTVNGWDGAVGTTTNTALFSSSFQLVASAVRDGEAGSITMDGTGPGVLGVRGQSAGCIDGATLAIPALESLNWGLAGSGVILHLKTVEVGNTVNNSDMFVDDGTHSNAFINLGLGIAGSINLSSYGYSIGDGETLVFGQPASGDVGYGLAGFTFEISDGAVPPQVADLVPDSGVSIGSYSNDTFEGLSVWVPDNISQQLFFDVPGSFPFVPGQPVYVRIEYHDAGQGRLFAEYESTGGDSYKDAEVHARSSRDNRGGFVYSYQMFEHPSFGGGQAGGNDFRFKVLGSDGTPLRIASVQISTATYMNETFEYAVSRPWLEPNTGPVKDFIDNQTLVGKVMAGYQGWFAVPNDLDDLGWRHWGRNANIAPDPTQITIDAWPYPHDYNPGSLYPAGDMVLQDGRPAYLFSTRDPDVVRRHFRWMRKYNIDGVYLQRFVTKNSGGVNGKPEFVLDNVRKAASAEGRIWAIEYDVSSLDGADGADIPLQLEVMTNDWNYLVNECRILEDPRYAHEDGKPVLFIWGFGTGNNPSTAAQADPVISWFASQNLHLIGGVSKGRINDANWQPVLRKYDTLLEWMEGSLSTLTSRRQQLEGFGMKLLPHAWPGFSWNNLQQTTFPTSYTPRNGGQFYWDRLKNAVNCGADQIFLGMFDEYDEGTVIMPFSDSHPDIHTEWGNYIDNGGRDPFWYLSLSGAGREMLSGLRSSSSGLPAESSVTPPAYGGNDATAYLATNNVEVGLVQKHPGDGYTEGAFIGGHGCRINTNIYFYFDIDDALVFQNPAGQAATIEVEYYDNDPSTFLRLQYDSLSAAYTQHPAIYDLPASGGWKNARWNVSDGWFGNRQNGASDFRIATFTGETVAIRRVSVFFPEEEGGSITGSSMQFVNDSLEWPDTDDAVGWRLHETDNLVSNNWEEVPGVVYTNGMVKYDLIYTNGAGFYRLQRPAKQ